jgi:hypothetical protein
MTLFTPAIISLTSHGTRKVPASSHLDDNLVRTKPLSRRTLRVR